MHCHSLAFAPATANTLCTLTLLLDSDGALLFIGPRRADSSAAHDSHFPAFPAFAVPNSRNDLGLAPLFDPQSRKWEQHTVPVVRTYQRLLHVFVLEAFSNDECVSLDEGVATQPQPSGSELPSAGAVELASALSRKRPAPGANTAIPSSKQFTANSLYIRLLQYQRDASNSDDLHPPPVNISSLQPSLHHPSLERWPND